MVSISVDHMRELTQELSQLDYKRVQLTEKNRVLKAQVAKLKKQLEAGGRGSTYRHGGEVSRFADSINPLDKQV